MLLRSIHFIPFSYIKFCVVLWLIVSTIKYKCSSLCCASIVGALPTIEYALSKGAKAVVLMSHLGRPDGKRTAKASMWPVAQVLKKLLNRYAYFGFIFVVTLCFYYSDKCTKITSRATIE